MVRSRRPQPTTTKEVSDVYQSKDELPDHLKHRYSVMLEDYDRHVEQKIQELKNKAKAEADKAYNHYMLEMWKLPKSIRSLNWESVLTALRGIDSEAGAKDTGATGDDKENNEADDEIRRMKEQIASDVRSAIKSGSRKRRQKAAAAAPYTGVRRSTRKRTAPEPFDETVLTSTANTTRMRTRRGLQTPGDISMVAPRDPPPLITPKVHGTTPFVPRTAKPNETTFSINGSPVFSGAGSTTIKRMGRGGRKTGPAATVKLGGGRELVLASLDDDGGGNGIELDEESLAKVQAVKNQLDKLLKLRSTNQ